MPRAKAGTRPAAKEKVTQATEKPRKPGAFVPGDPRINRTIPGPGRRKDRFKNLCQKLTIRSTRKYVRRILRNPDHQHYMSALRWASEHGFGKPDAHLDVSARMTIEQLVAKSNEEPDK